ncbi:MAG: Nif3-like dinuclear metal center hexameric protein [Bacteroidales bacterium]|nr:Nif3-like dinuclear metal center hexameric protein [Bacteroidales bacterium]
MKLNEIMSALETWAPLSFQEEWDNSGLIIGDPHQDVSGIMVSLDTTLEVLEEAHEKQCNLVISHHPLIFNGITNLTPRLPEYAAIRFAIRNEISVMAVHTNLDNRADSLNHLLGDKLGLEGMEIVQPRKGYLKKLATFCPLDHADRIRDSLFSAGAGHIGNYDNCSFNATGQGTFRASEKARPFVGEKNSTHYENEIRIEVIFPQHVEQRVIEALRESHPYEEVAYDIYPLDNLFPHIGSGVFGSLPEPVMSGNFLEAVKESYDIKLLRHTNVGDKLIKTVAICSGSGSFLIQHVNHKGIDAYLTGDLKYHDFQGVSTDFLLVDIGHFESEHFVKEMLKELLIEKFPNFAVLISERESNPIKYF